MFENRIHDHMASSWPPTASVILLFAFINSSKLQNHMRPALPPPTDPAEWGAAGPASELWANCRADVQRGHPGKTHILENKKEMRNRTEYGRIRTKREIKYNQSSTSLIILYRNLVNLLKCRYTSMHQKTLMGQESLRSINYHVLTQEL